jgi:hypothetical protein
VATGGPELAEELERTGYAAYVEEETSEVEVALAPRRRTSTVDDDPFADPLA